MASVCAECAAKCGSCCHAKDFDDMQFKFGLTFADVKRICKDTGLAPKDFAQMESVSAEAFEKIKATTPGMERMFPHHKRIGLRFDDEGRGCRLLSKDGTGCRLRTDRRPRFCALFPSWYLIGQHLDVLPFVLATPDHCMALERAKEDPQVMFKLMGVEEVDIVKLCLLSYAELEEHKMATPADLDDLFWLGASARWFAKK